MKTDRLKFNEFKKLINQNGDSISKVLTEIAEGELDFLDKEFVGEDRSFNMTTFEVVWETSGVIDNTSSQKLVDSMPKMKSLHGLMLMIMDVFLIVRSTYEFGNELHKAHPDKYEYKNPISVEDLFQAIVKKRCY